MIPFRLPILLLVLPLLLLGGCLQSEVKITLQPDGSGTVAEQVVVSRELIRKIDSFGNAMMLFLGALAGETPRVTLYDEGELRKKAALMGPGVTLQSVRKVDVPAGEGYAAVYRFEDINALRISTNPARRLRLGAVETEGGDAGDLRFQFVREPHPLLVITPPRKGPTVTQALAPLKDLKGEKNDSPFLAGLKMSLLIEVQGEVVTTNAAFRKDSAITLLDLDFDRLASLTELPGDATAVPGLRSDLLREVRVEFLSPRH